MRPGKRITHTNLFFVFLYRYSIVLLSVICFLFISVSGFGQVAADFTTDTTSGCAPFTVHCTSTENDGVTDWYWTASDGQISTEQNPVFTFVTPGRYRIKLKTSDNSSADSTFKDVYANGIPPTFTYKYNDICTVPVPVRFYSYDTSATGNYHWDFGDSTVSIERNPVHTYQAQGSYNVRLTIYSEEGCIDSSLSVIQTGLVTVDFSAPATACSNSTVLFTSTSTSTPKTATWTVNGVPVGSSYEALSYSFTSPGAYLVKLTEDFGGCSFEKQKQIVVYRTPTASFNQLGTLQSCIYPSSIQFSNTSLNANSYTWFFGDGTTSAATSPLHPYSTNGQFSPYLIATSTNGCSDTLVKPNLVLLGPPIVTGLKGLPASRCLPYTIQPSAFVSSPEPIVSYDWDFGNGDHASDSAPSYTYTVQGYYNVSLILKTTSGCTDTFVVNKAVSVGDSVVADFTVDKNTACGSDTFHFTGSAPRQVNSWTWRFGDGLSASGQTVSHRYISTENQTVSLDVNNNGCRLRTERANFVFVQPPIAAIRVKYDCTNQLHVDFTDASQGAATWQWNFGDGSPPFTEKDPLLHVYAASGFYNVTLLTTNAGCTSTDTVLVPVLNTKPVFAFDPADGYICRKSGLYMAATNPEYIADYYWDFDDGKSAFSDTSIYNYYDKAGTYYPSLVAKYKNGCYDTIYSPQPVTVTGPTASFNTRSVPNCVNAEVVFTDESVTDSQHNIVNWQWDCGDAYTETRTTPSFTHTYTTDGSYPASLLVTDNNNCTDTAYYTVTINDLPAVSAGQDTFVCDGKNKVQLGASGNATSYVWNADATLSCSNCAAPVASPPRQSAYVVTGKNGNGCAASDTVEVEVVRPFNMTIIHPSTEICQTKNVVLDVSGADLYSWQPPAGLSDATAANPIASPDVTTTYTVTGRDKHFCFSQTGQVLVTVYPNPQADITDSLITAEKGDVNLLKTTGSSDIIRWSWLPPAGLSCADCPQPTATAAETITYSAVAYTDHGCSDTDKITIYVLCNKNKIYIPTAFTPNHDGKNDWFYIMSSIANPIRSFAIYSRNGERIFAKTNTFTNNPQQGWDGMWNGHQATPDTYVYRVEIQCNKEVVPFTGTVTIVR